MKLIEIFSIRVPNCTDNELEVAVNIKYDGAVERQIAKKDSLSVTSDWHRI